MRPSKAYIASFSTTGLLIALAVLLLIVVGALMAFREQADADRGPGASDVTVDGAVPARVGALSDRATPRGASLSEAPSTTGVVLTPAGAAPVTVDGPAAPVELPAPVPPSADPPTDADPAAPAEPEPVREEDAPEAGMELGADLGPLMDAVNPETGDVLTQVLEEIGGGPPGDDGEPATSPHAQPAR